MRNAADLLDKEGDNVFAWAVRHASWTLARFVFKKHGVIAWELLRRKAYGGELAQLGGNVMSRLPDAVEAHRKMALDGSNAAGW